MNSADSRLHQPLPPRCHWAQVNLLPMTRTVNRRSVSHPRGRIISLSRLKPADNATLLFAGPPERDSPRTQNKLRITKVRNVAFYDGLKSSLDTERKRK